jgi:ABC-2 type transport system ATP-binding protein
MCGSLGYDPVRHERAYLERVGMVFQETGVDRFLTVAEVIEQFRGLYPHPLSLDDVLAAVGLGDQRGQLVRRLSGGQQRRLDVGVALAGNPELLFLDEPTTGFDPAARRGAWEMIENLTSLGTTVFLTTHYMDEADHLADRVAIIAAGRIVAEGTPASLRASFGQRTTISLAVPSLPLPPGLAEHFEADGTDLVALLDDPVTVLHELTSWALDHGLTIERLQVSRPTLEDVYLSLVGETGG